MNRRVLVTILALATACAGQVRAEEPVDRILRDLKKLGYDNISVESTWLRRTRIFAQNDEAQREIILNPNTGEILRDLWIPLGKASHSGTSGGLLDDGSNSGSGSGSDGSADDSGGDDNGDNSGHGSGDSGSGGSGSGGSGSGDGDDD